MGVLVYVGAKPDDGDAVDDLKRVALARDVAGAQAVKDVGFELVAEPLVEMMDIADGLVHVLWGDCLLVLALYNNGVARYEVGHMDVALLCRLCGVADCTRRKGMLHDGVNAVLALDALTVVGVLEAGDL